MGKLHSTEKELTKMAPLPPPHLIEDLTKKSGSEKNSPKVAGKQQEKNHALV